MRILVVVLLAIIAAYLAARIYGTSRWRARTAELRARLDSGTTEVRLPSIAHDDLSSLPPPVERYLRTVLTDGEPVITRVYVRHEGTFNMSEADAQWKPFTSEQWVATRRPASSGTAESR